MAKVMMIASGKGGTGKSTVAVFMATELALDGNRTLLIELDAGLRSVDVISGTGRQAVYDISDVLKGRCEPQKAILTSPHTDKLHIIAAPYKSSDTDFTGFKQMTDSLYEDYDYILIDTAAGLANAFYAACGPDQTCAAKWTSLHRRVRRIPVSSGGAGRGGRYVLSDGRFSERKKLSDRRSQAVWLCEPHRKRGQPAL